MEQKSDLVIKLSSCPGCDSKDINSFFNAENEPQILRKDSMVFEMLGIKPEPAQYDVCKSCGLLFLNPRWSGAALGRLYGEEDIFRKSGMTSFFAKAKNKTKLNEYFSKDADLNLSDAEKYYRFMGRNVDKNQPPSPNHFRNAFWIKKSLPNSKIPVIFDVGAGFGVAQSALEKAGFKYYGFEPSVLCSTSARSWGRNVETVDFKNLSVQLKEKQGIIYTNHFLEHVDRPIECLKLLKDCMHDKGYLFISVPTSNYLSKNCGYLIQNPYLVRSAMSWRHMSHFNEVSLENMLRLAGLELVAWKNSEESILALAKKSPSQTNQVLKKPNLTLLRINVFTLPTIARPVHKYFYVPFFKLKLLVFKVLRKITNILHVQTGHKKIKGTRN